MSDTRAHTSTHAFTESEKREYCLMLSMGCDRQTACHYLRKTAVELRQAVLEDEQFERQILRAEATPEFHHMRNLYNATKDEKHWRASVWWLERRAPDRYARQGPDTLTATQLQAFIEELAAKIVDEVSVAGDQRRLLSRLVEITQKLRAGDFDMSSDENSLRRSTEVICAAEDSDAPASLSEEC